jgi:hypothetical protein
MDENMTISAFASKLDGTLEAKLPLDHIPGMMPSHSSKTVIVSFY